MSQDFSKRIARAKQHLQNSKIDPSNKNHITKFVDQLSAEGIKPIRQLKYLYTLKTLSELINKDFSHCSKDDIVTLLAKINSSSYEDWTKRDFKVVLKRFYRWLRGQEGQMFDRGQYPKEVSWISTGKKIQNKKLPKQLLTIDDVNLLANAASNLRDKCFVLVLYDTGARIGEILNIKCNCRNNTIRNPIGYTFYSSRLDRRRISQLLYHNENAEWFQ
jgi:integrase